MDSQTYHESKPARQFIDSISDKVFLAPTLGLDDRAQVMDSPADGLPGDLMGQRIRLKTEIFTQMAKCGPLDRSA